MLSKQYCPDCGYTCVKIDSGGKYRVFWKCRRCGAELPKGRIFMSPKADNGRISCPRQGRSSESGVLTNEGIWFFMLAFLLCVVGMFALIEFVLPINIVAKRFVVGGLLVASILSKSVFEKFGKRTSMQVIFSIVEDISIAWWLLYAFQFDLNVSIVVTVAVCLFQLVNFPNKEHLWRFITVGLAGSIILIVNLVFVRWILNDNYSFWMINYILIAYNIIMAIETRLFIDASSWDGNKVVAINILCDSLLGLVCLLCINDWFINAIGGMIGL